MTNLLLILTILSSFLANLETKTLQSDFTVTVAENVASPMNYPGSLTMQGTQFKLSMFNIEAAYDGKTLYMYSPDTDELTLTNPTEQELVQANPFLYAKALVDVCNITERTITNNQSPITNDQSPITNNQSPITNNQSPITIITLTPKDQSIGINRFVLKVRTADLMPLQLEIKEGNKTSTLKLKNPAFVTSSPKYEIQPGKDTYLNDMRF